MDDQLLGTTQPMLSISLDPGETVVAGAGEFAWMTDSIQMTARPAGGDADEEPSRALRRTLGESALSLSAYTAKDCAGTIAFAARLPGAILSIDVTPEREYLVHRQGFLAGMPGIEVTAGFQQTLAAGDEFILWRVGGTGRAWVELSGDVVKRDLQAGTSLRTQPWHIGMADASLAVQMAELRPGAGSRVRAQAHHFAVLSGPGAVWLQSMPLLATRRGRLAGRRARRIPAAEGTAGIATPN
jgi:uncharacterized protein (AIM24 family)